MDKKDIIEQFHLMWDNFPGLARLINNKHEILASNEIARSNGFCEGCICAKVGPPETHKDCLLGKMFKTGTPQIQRFSKEKIKGWMPVDGHPELCIHFAVIVHDMIIDE